MTGMQCADGEIKAARAAKAFGVPFTLSTMSICSIEDVAEAVQAPFWFQLYVMRDQEFLEAIIERARRANCSALVLTLDLQILGQRHKDLKNGLSAPPRLTLPVLLDLATKWRWGIEMLRTKRRFFGNIVGHAKGVGDPSSLIAWTAEQFDPQLDWGKIARIRDLWGGKLILKASTIPRMPAWPRISVPMRSSSATMAAGNWTARSVRSACCPRSSRRWATGSRSISTAASARARTS